MGLYLCVFDGDDEVDGIDVGAYSDWGRFVETVVRELEGGTPGAKYPTLTLHSDCDGQWSPEECSVLARDLGEIASAFRKMPPVGPSDGWQAQVAKQFGLRFESLYDCFFDVDAENLLDRLKGLAAVARRIDRPVLFQ
jgi:hypothetical protein